MRNGLLAGSIAAVALCACSNNKQAPADAPKIIDAAIDAKPIDAPPDAQTFDFSCLDMPLPTTATATITLSGSVQVLTFNGGTPVLTPVADAKVDACKVGAANCTGANHFGLQATSAALSGAWSIGPVTTVPAAQPLDAFVHMTPPAASSQRPTSVYPAQPFVANQGTIPVITFTDGMGGSFALIQAFAGHQQNPANGLVVIAVTDCASKPLKGAIVHVKQNGAEVGQIFDASALSAMAGGGFIVFNVPPGPVDVSATFMGMDFRVNPVQTVTSVAGEDTFTQIRPGP